MLAIWHLFVSGAHLHLNRIEQAIHELQRSVEINPNDLPARFYLAAALALVHRVDSAAKAVAIGIERMPGFTISRFPAQREAITPFIWCNASASWPECAQPGFPNRRRWRRPADSF